MIWSYEGIGQMLKNLGCYSQGLFYFRQALLWSHKSQDRRGLGFALKGVGELCGIMGDRFTSRRLMREAIAIFSDINYDIGLAYSMKTLADLEKGFKNPELSLSLYFQAMEIFESRKNFTGYHYASIGATDHVNKEEGKCHLIESFKYFSQKGIMYGASLARSRLNL